MARIEYNFRRLTQLILLNLLQPAGRGTLHGNWVRVTPAPRIGGPGRTKRGRASRAQMIVAGREPVWSREDKFRVAP